MHIEGELLAFLQKGEKDRKLAQDETRLNPYMVAKQNIKRQLAIEEAYRVSVLRKVHSLSNLSTEEYHCAAQSMDEVFFKKGDKIISQDDKGDSFFIIETGKVAVSVR